MAHHHLKHADLVNYDGAAAGHDGVLSNPDGDLVIKPCTSAEIAFYQLCIDQDEPLYEFMPHFMGTLKLSTLEQEAALQEVNHETSSQAVPANADPSTPQPASSSAAPAKGKKLATEQAIVLENVAAGFVKPNIMDLKLGARLWADDAPPSKRQRLDDVSSHTTSGSLGFRIAGMRVWKADAGEYKVYDKMYGRTLSSDSVKEGFQEYFGKQGAKHALTEQERTLARRMSHEIVRLQQILEALESRMIGASILMVYEGDEAAMQHALEHEAMRGAGGEDMPKDDVTEHVPDGDNGDEDKDSVEEEMEPQVCRVAMIDFAHSSIIPGQGCDENVLRGISGALRVLEEVYS